MRYFALMFVFFTSSLLANPALIITDERPLGLAQELTLTSAILQTPPKVHVYLPADYSQTADHIRYPLILTLDGWALSQSVAGVVNHLGNTASMPKAIVVAIDSDDDYGWGPEIYTSESGWRGPKDQRLDGFSKGGADKHIKFLKTELLPMLDSRYRTNDFRILIGMSPSAAFALHTFWKAPQMFDAHFVFAATDVIGMGYTPESTFIDKMSQSLAANPERKGYLYVGSAKREADENPARNKNVIALEQALAPYTTKNFRLKVEHIADFGHYPMALPGLLNAIDLVFPRKDFDMAGKFKQFLSQEAPVKAITDYYHLLSQQVGFKVHPNADLRRNSSSLRVSGYRLRNQGKYTESEKIYRLWLNISPNAVGAWYGLGATMEAKGDVKQALQYWQQAVKLAKTQQSPLLSMLREKINSLGAE